MDDRERRLIDPGPVAEGALELARAEGMTFTVADVLHRRGATGGDELHRWLDPKLSHLTSPEGMADLDACADRIVRAIRNRERVAVFGDYDCDGITSATIMTEVIEALGGDVRAFVANRFAGGYGFSQMALERVRQSGASLLVTCDCGSSDHERIEAARKVGIDTVVIDHHLVPDDPLPAVAFLNPHRPECGFAYKGLASCGLALFVATALRKRLDPRLDVRRAALVRPSRGVVPAAAARAHADRPVVLRAQTQARGGTVARHRAGADPGLRVQHRRHEPLRLLHGATGPGARCSCASRGSWRGGGGRARGR